MSDKKKYIVWYGYQLYTYAGGCGMDGKVYDNWWAADAAKSVLEKEELEPQGLPSEFLKVIEWKTKNPSQQ